MAVAQSILLGRYSSPIKSWRETGFNNVKVGIFLTRSWWSQLFPLPVDLPSHMTFHGVAWSCCEDVISMAGQHLVEDRSGRGVFVGDGFFLRIPDDPSSVFRPQRSVVVVRLTRRVGMKNDPPLLDVTLFAVYPFEGQVRLTRDVAVSGAPG